MSILNPPTNVITPNQGHYIEVVDQFGRPQGLVSLVTLLSGTALGAAVPTPNPTPSPTPIVLPAITASPIAPATVIGFQIGSGNVPIATLSAVPAGASRNISPNDGRVVLGTGGAQLIVGMTAATAGTINYTITDSLVGSTSVSLAVAVVVTAASTSTGTTTTPTVTIPGAGQLANQRVGLVQPAVFVSPSGSDSNPGTQTSPFLTPTAAQTAMRAQGVKTCYFRGGTYPLTTAFNISEADNGTSWLGYPGETAIFDGGGTTVGGFLLQYFPTGVTVDHLTFRNFSTCGVWIHGGGGAGAVGNTVSNCEIYNISIPSLTAGAGQSAGILMTFNCTHNLIHHNYVHDVASTGISMAAGSSGESIVGNNVTFNRVVNTNQTGQLDTGGIYCLDRTNTQSGNIIAYNYIQNTSKNASGGGPGAGCDNTKHIYLDDMASGFTVTQNITCGNAAMAFQYHGGTNNQVFGNIFDISQNMLMCLYQDDSEFGGTVMSGNTFLDNIVYSSTAYNGNVGQAGQPGLFTVGFVSGLTKPNSSGNIYWNTTNTTTPFPNSGAIDVIDPHPHVVNPNFNNPANHDYSFNDGGAAVAAFGFQPINQSLIGPNVQSLGSATATLSGLPSTSTEGANISGSVVLTYIQTAYAVLYTNGADEGTRTAFQGGTLPALSPQSTGSYTYRVYDSLVGGNLLAASGAISVGGPVPTAILANIPTSISVGGSLSGTVTLRYITTAYACLATGGSDVGSRVSFSGSVLPSLTPAATGTYTVRVYAAASGGTPLAESAAINVHAVGALVSPAFFLATNGSDSNPGTQAAPFLTFEAAQAAMQGSSTKTCYVRGGTYNRTASIKFNDSSSTAIGGPGPKTHDNGTTFVRFPGEAPIVDGGGTVTDLFFLDYHSSAITLDGLEIRNCLNSGVHLNGYNNTSNGDNGTITGCIVQNCYIHNIPNGVSNTGAGNTGGVRGSFATQNNIIRNNKITDTFGPSVSFVAGSTSETIAGNQILNNICMRSNNTGQSDTGSIYLLDRGHGSFGTTTFVIAGNYVQDAGGGPAVKAIYMDDFTSNVSISGNIICGQMCNTMQIHGGDHVVFSNNIFDVTSCTQQIFYMQEATLSTPGNFGMNADSLTGNIIYSGVAPVQQDLWLYETDGVSPMGMPTVSGNLYYAVSGTFPNTGTVIDSSPKVANPMFTNAAAHDYSFTDGGAAVAAAIGFQPINISLIGPQG